MSRIEDHVSQKRHLLAWYDRVLENAALLGVDEDRESGGSASLREKRGDLEREHFVVAICGQMNAGKSTLLNALLFRDEVLPASPTTMTAKIALLSGGGKPEVEATLYSADEFPEIVRAASGDRTAKEEMEEARGAARKAGLREDDLLRRPGRVERRDGLDALAQFVAIPSDGGLYTPYVKSVAVRADLPWLHQVTVADTPGTNDPNPERDRITREWITRADAVVYVTYAGQAGMTAEDVRFLDENLLHLDPRRRIIAVNKCDVQPDEGAIWSHLRGLRAHGDLRMQALFADESSIVLVSGIGALVAGMLADGRALSAEAGEWQPILAASGWLEASRHRVDELRALVEERVLATRGEGMIEAHRLRLEAVFERAERRLDREAENLQERIGYLSASVEELNKERKRVSEVIVKVSGLVNAERNRVTKVLEESGVRSNTGLAGVAGRIITDVGESIHPNKVKDIDNLAEHTAWAIPHAIAIRRDEIINHLRTAVHEIEDALNRAESSLSEQLLSGGLGDRPARDHVLVVSVRSMTKKVEQSIEARFDANGAQEIIKKSTNFFQRGLNLAGGRRSAVEALMPTLEKMVRSGLDLMADDVHQTLAKECGTSVEDMELSVRGILGERRAALEELTKEGASKAADRAQSAAGLGAIADRRARLDGLRADFEQRGTVRA